jgi:hypothetical protein
MNSQFPLGTKVRIKPEFAEGDDSIYVIVGEDEGKGRADIQPIEWNHGMIVPVERIAVEMIERI